MDKDNPQTSGSLDFENIWLDIDNETDIPTADLLAEGWFG